MDLGDILGAPLTQSFVGGLTAMITASFMARVSERVRLGGRAWERVQDRRFDAYEHLIHVSRSLRMTHPTGRHEEGFVETVCSVVSSEEALVSWVNDLSLIVGEIDPWIDQRVSKHIRYLTDYFTNYRIAFFKTEAELRSELAVRTKDEIVALGAETSQIAHDFFQRIDSRKFGFKGNGKYALSETEARLAKTELVAWKIEKGQMMKSGEELPF